MMVSGNSASAPNGLYETEPLLGDLTRKTAQRLAQYQQDQMESKAAFREAVLRVAGFGRAVDTLA